MFVRELAWSETIEAVLSEAARRSGGSGRRRIRSSRQVRPAANRRPTRPRLAQTTDSGSSFWPVGPIWMSVPISGHTPQS